jgi:hypothetical protein
MSIDNPSLVPVTRPTLCQRRPRTGTRHQLGIRSRVRASLGLGVRPEPDTQSDTRRHPTPLLIAAVRAPSGVATDPCLGVSPWGRTPYGADSGGCL